MCATVYPLAAREVDTVRGLANMLGGKHHLVRDKGYEGELSMDSCLCQLDLSATLAGRGYIEDGLGDWWQQEPEED